MGQKVMLGYCGMVAVIFTGMYASITMGDYSKSQEKISANELEKAKVENGYILKEQDLNSNGINEKYFQVNGKKYFLEIDGKNLNDTLIAGGLEKTLKGE